MLADYSSTIVVIPAKNEALTVGKVVRRIKTYFSGTVVVIDDASTDETIQVARDAGAKVLSLPFSLGAWGATQTGLRYAVKKNYHIAITMDADGQHESESIPDLLYVLNTTECDVVIGAFPQRGSFARRFAWTLFRQLSGITLEDLTSGFRVYNRAAIELLASRHATLLEYQDLGVLILLKKSGFCIQETPTLMHPRSVGHSRIFSSWWAVSHYMVYTITLCFARSQLHRKNKCPTK
jgi:glycosyltransferase involved in cell wall biosynthesis